MSYLPAIRAELVARAKLLGLGTLVAMAASAIVLGVVLHRDMISDAEERGAFQVERARLTAQLDSASAAADDSTAAAVLANERAARAERTRDSVDLVARRRIAAAQAAEREARERTAEAGASVDASVDSVRVIDPVLGDSLEVQVERERDGWRSTAEALREQARGVATMLAAAETEITAQRLRGDAWERAEGQTRAALGVSQALNATLSVRVDALENPGLLSRVRAGLPWLAAGGAIVCAFTCR